MGHDPVTIREAAQLEVLLFVGLAFVGGLVIVYWGFQTYQFGRIIRDTPTEPVSGVAMGRTQIEGTVLPAERCFDQPFTEGQCVYAEFKVKEYRDDPSDDDNGKEWDTIQSETVSEPFYIDDETGTMRVEPNEETIYELSEKRSRTIEVSTGDSPPPAVHGFLGDDAHDGPMIAGQENLEQVPRSEFGSVSGTRNKRKYIQTVLPVGETAYVFGGATRRDPADITVRDDSEVIRTDPSTNEFVISDQGEFTLASQYTQRSLLYIIAGIITSAILLAVLAQITITGPIYGIEWAMP